MRCICGRHAAPRRPQCHGCRKAAWRQRHPMRAAYAELRWSARRRGIVFTISFRYFAYFARRTNYLNRKGNGGDCLTVDRRDNLRGYEIGNIRALTRTENTRKMIYQDEKRWRGGGEWHQGGRYETPPALLEQLHQAIEAEGGKPF